MRLSREDLKTITHRVRPRNQAAWFEEYLGVKVPFDRDGPILTPSTYEALLAKRLGVGLATAYYARFRAARAAIGMPELNPHDLRHSLASEIVSRGGSLVDVQEALHQEALQSSRRYAHLYPERIKTVLSGIGRQEVPTQSKLKPPRTKLKKAA